MAIVVNGKISLLSFILGCSVFSISILSFASHGLAHTISIYWHGILFLYFAVVNAIILVLYHGQAYQVVNILSLIC